MSAMLPCDLAQIFGAHDLLWSNFSLPRLSDNIRPIAHVRKLRLSALQLYKWYEDIQGY